MKSLLDLEEGDCRFPFGESDLQFCGKLKHTYMRFEKLCISPYCHEHHLICTVEPTARKAAA